VTTSGRHLLIDEPVPHVRRLTLDRPEKRNPLDKALPFGDDPRRPEEAGA